MIRKKKGWKKYFWTVMRFEPERLQIMSPNHTKGKDNKVKIG